jgi:hypothetical protein
MPRSVKMADASHLCLLQPTARGNTARRPHAQRLHQALRRVRTQLVQSTLCVLVYYAVLTHLYLVLH